jgi:hypothetical protein
VVAVHELPVALRHVLAGPLFLEQVFVGAVQAAVSLAVAPSLPFPLLGIQSPLGAFHVTIEPSLFVGQPPQRAFPSGRVFRFLAHCRTLALFRFACFLALTVQPSHRFVRATADENARQAVKMARGRWMCMALPPFGP